MAGETPFRTDGDDLLVAIRLTPKGGRDAVEGISELSDGRAVLTARVRAAPTDGEANAALIQLLARTFGVPKREVSFQSGETARLKILRIGGEGKNLTEWQTKFSA